MAYQWSLDELYHGYDDPAFQADFDALDGLQDDLRRAAQAETGMSAQAQARAILLAMEAYQEKIRKLSGYIHLRMSVASTDAQTVSRYRQVSAKNAKIALPMAMAQKVLARIDEKTAEKWAQEDPIFADYAFLLAENRQQAAHLLSDELEETVAQMNLTGGSAWSRLFSQLTATLQVAYQGKTVTLSDVRNLAYSDDAQVRKQAYEAELSSYAKIEEPLAFALNNIKAQVTMLSQKRGYASPLQMTLEKSRMSRKTLDAMLTAMDEYLPVFHRYLKTKAQLLGHKGALPWYDLFAPVGSCEGRYTVQDARTLLLDVFGQFEPDMAQMMRRAFDENWIDFYSRPGKVGGAFCSGVPSIGQSRILTNYDETLGDVQTLAHELGHAYHNLNILDHRPLNRGYSMPVAETASNFNETHLIRHLLKTADAGTRLFLLERCLSDTTQIICDIYSRYLFETAVFDACADQFLMPDQLCALMIDAQKKAYGDGLDHECLHPYMWACKSHYYSEGRSFYNFPYAFGGLFAMGLYRCYETQGPSFVPKYRAILHATTVTSVEGAAQMAGIDLTTPDFWRQSLKAYADMADEFETLAQK